MVKRGNVKIYVDMLFSTKKVYINGVKANDRDKIHLINRLRDGSDVITFIKIEVDKILITTV